MGTERPAVVKDHPLHRTALDQFNAIVDHPNSVDRDEEFFEWLKIKEVNVNWTKMFNLFKRELSKDFEEEWCDMWSKEKFEEKLATLATLKEIYGDGDSPAWRPKTGDIEPQTIDLDVRYLKAVKDHYLKLVTAEEETLNKLKEKLSIEWNRIKMEHEKILAAKKLNDSLNENINKKLNDNVDCVSQCYSSI